MKRLILFAIAVLLSISNLMASGPLLKAVQQAAVAPPTKTNWSRKNYKTFQAVPDNLNWYVYTDLQCKNTLPSEGGLVRATFSTGGSNRLVYVQYNAACNYFTAKLFLADSQGNVLDNLEVLAYGDFSVVKDYVIENGVIKIYSIKPTSTSSLSFWDFGHKFTSFAGTRCDEEYVVDGNKFKLKKRTTYNTKTYTYSQIHPDEKFTFKIWNGSETVKNVQNF